MPVIKSKRNKNNSNSMSIKLIVVISRMGKARYPTDLTKTPHGLLVKHELYGALDKILKEGQEPIRVPLIPDRWGNELQYHWAALNHIKGRSVLVEEVFAIRSSLLDAQNHGLLNVRERQPLSFFTPQITAVVVSTEHFLRRFGLPRGLTTLASCGREGVALLRPTGSQALA